MEKGIKKKIIEIIKGDYQIITADDAERTADEISELFEKEIIEMVCEKIDKDYKGRDITIYELGDWLMKLSKD